MGRSRKSDAANTEELNDIETQNELENQVETEQNPDTTGTDKVEEIEKQIPARVLELMRLYPQYEEFWVTPRGFVHPGGTPKYCIKGATLYKNKFYNK